MNRISTVDTTTRTTPSRAASVALIAIAGVHLLAEATASRRLAGVAEQGSTFWLVHLLLAVPLSLLLLGSALRGSTDGLLLRSMRSKRSPTGAGTLIVATLSYVLIVGVLLVEVFPLSPLAHLWLPAGWIVLLAATLLGFVDWTAAAIIPLTYLFVGHGLRLLDLEARMAVVWSVATFALSIVALGLLVRDWRGSRTPEPSAPGSDP